MENSIKNNNSNTYEEKFMMFYIGFIILAIGVGYYPIAIKKDEYIIYNILKTIVSLTLIIAGVFFIIDNAKKDVVIDVLNKEIEVNIVAFSPEGKVLDIEFRNIK